MVCCLHLPNTVSWLLISINNWVIGTNYKEQIYFEWQILLLTTSLVIPSLPLVSNWDPFIVMIFSLQTGQVSEVWKYFQTIADYEVHWLNAVMVTSFQIIYLALSPSYHFKHSKLLLHACNERALFRDRSTFTSGVHLYYNWFHCLSSPMNVKTPMFHAIFNLSIAYPACKESSVR